MKSRLFRLRTRFDRRRRELRQRQIRRILRHYWVNEPAAHRAVELLRFCLKNHTQSGRRRLFDSPLLGAWVQDVLFWLTVRKLAEAISTRRGSPGSRDLLFRKVADTEYLVGLVPSGRLDPGFVARARRRAGRVLWERMTDLPRILLSHLPSSVRPLELPLFFREIPDEGCPSDRIRVGTSPRWIAWKGGTPPRALQAHWKGNSLLLASAARLERHARIPDTEILVSPRLLSGAKSLRVGPPVQGLERRLGRALTLAEKAWPRAAGEIRHRTWLVVPLAEPGTVSYSHLSRPGISYINVFGKTDLQLADDLLHEAAHHRLHALQEVEKLLDDDGESHYFSPWRRSFRPLHGILHGTYTFLYRAELLARLSRLRPRPGWGSGIGRAFGDRHALERETSSELDRCRVGLHHLFQAAEDGDLTEAGVKLLIRMRERHRRLEEPGLSRTSLSSIL